LIDVNDAAIGQPCRPQPSRLKFIPYLSLGDQHSRIPYNLVKCLNFDFLCLQRVVSTKSASFFFVACGVRELLEVGYAMLHLL
jgi:hypothetical protein